MYKCDSKEQMRQPLIVSAFPGRKFVWHSSKPATLHNKIFKNKINSVMATYEKGVPGSCNRLLGTSWKGMNIMRSSNKKNRLIY